VAWLAELFPNPRQRERVLGFTQAASSFGGLMVAVANELSVKFAVDLPAIHGMHEAWRYTLISGLVPAIPLILIRPFLPESPVWQQKKSSGQLRRPSIAELFRPELRRATLVSAVVFASCYGMAFGAIQHLPQIVPGLADVKAEAKARQTHLVQQAQKEDKPAPAPKALAAAGKRIEEERAAEVQKWQEIGVCWDVFPWRARGSDRQPQSFAKDIPLARADLRAVVFLVVEQLAGGKRLAANHKMGRLSGRFPCHRHLQFWGNYLPRIYPVHLRGTGESFAANIGGRILGTSAAWFTFTFSAAIPQALSRIALTAAVVAGMFALVGAILTRWLPEPGSELMDGSEERSKRSGQIKPQSATSEALIAATPEPRTGGKTSKLLCYLRWGLLLSVYR
jgi:hypothetical protein